MRFLLKHKPAILLTIFPCAALFLLAFVLRALGVDYGYFHGDERISDAAKVLTGDLIPGQHFYPPFINYVNGIAFGALFAVGLPFGWWDGVGSFRAQYFDDPTVFYVTARLVTAAFGALLAPIFYLCARRIGLAPGTSLITGLLAALFPLAVYQSHIAKGDVAMATFIVAAIAATLARVGTDRPFRWDALFGLAVVLALSFKHSAVFVLAPLALGHLLILGFREGARAAGLAFLRGIIVVLILWPILNIGTILDFKTFLEYQQIQSVMSIRGNDGPLSGVATLAARLPHLVLGLTPVFGLVALVFPVCLLAPIIARRFKPHLLMIWLALMIGTLSTAVLVGPRQPEHLWIGNFAGFLLLAGLGLAGLLSGVRSGLRPVVTVLIIAGVGLATLGAARPIMQAIADPVYLETDDILRDRYVGTRVLSMVETDIPIKEAARDMQIARWERLAEKYQVTLPDMAEERLQKTEAPDAQFIFPMPVAMYGLEHVDEDAEDYTVQAHAWPLQSQEWQLDYWLKQGFTVVILKDLDYMRNEVSSQLIRAFAEELVGRCTIVDSIEPRKPLFLEREISVFECAEADDNASG
ncbi:Dolichyl-phosphate-mannose-protein mannosyltransferase [Roseovarius sp. THAF9]|uniref:ArnT family glycosyltransferase n=1 Tax=Roseovarius sp. THAF9 TaxID=2587847 RepID=UPI001267C96E|nr:phospholipid carrier-dependent glycosyltransferase [Roseovarius sp. THAF9]QFT94769.1 Dolichyl-phosphate-mannose-protein mannosyltransferase [Roseovarius sp. THAF9]